MDKAEKQADQFDRVYQEAKIYLDKEINKILISSNVIMV